MRRTRRMQWSPTARTSLVLGILCCLCFSAGEGLRLTPLPASPFAGAGADTDQQPGDLSPAGTELNRTGPLDVPAPGQVQNRGKRQAPECDCVPASVAREVLFDRLRHPGGGRQLTPSARLFEARPPGRAPPLHV